MKCRSGADNPRKIGGDNYSDTGGLCPFKLDHHTFERSCMFVNDVRIMRGVRNQVKLIYGHAFLG